MTLLHRIARALRCLLEHAPAELLPRFGIFERCARCGRFAPRGQG